ncbi:histidine phosphotransferase family protein [Pedomonas mirosovicensis]|uniref:histidine phosphotransferase family protein n=1 Tax=Pedomonas mirosovicensis TaxID=2908641 RepID=UPI0021681837|nr:histidine phosphotransferase family protein [Pedomonas mirosovicensis]MCH8684650.1 histidine phosphotransferase family protein [Pedomonas mirosovicensis]
MKSVDFASLLCSRLCHDLVSPVGALSNGVELLTDETDPEMQAQCLQLLTDSVRQAANRLKFFRLAFGGGGSFSAQVDVREAQTAIQGMFPADKVRLEWLISPSVLPKTAIKVLLNLALIAGDTLLRGGVLQVAAEQAGNALDIAVRAEGPRLLLGDDLRQALSGEAADSEITPRVAPALLVQTLLADVDAKLQISEPEPGVLLLGVRCPV